MLSIVNWKNGSYQYPSKESLEVDMVVSRSIKFNYIRDIAIREVKYGHEQSEQWRI